MKTLIVDLDGCVLQHHNSGAVLQWSTYDLIDSKGFVEMLNEWERRCYFVIFMTARKECCRSDLERALRTHGLFWDMLIMGVPHGERIVVNDIKDNGAPTAHAVIVERNQKWHLPLE